MSEKIFPAQVARRDFLKAGSLAVAGLAGTSWPSLAFGAVRTLPGSILSAGYAAEEPKEGEIEWLVPAEKVLAGDAAFISRDARVTIRSSTRAASLNGKIGGAAIDVVFPAIGYQPDSYPTYRAWSFRQDEFLASASSPVSFRVPIDAVGGLQLLFTRMKEEAGADDGTAPKPDDMVALTLGSSSRLPKLRRGIYVVAYGESGMHGVTNWAAVPITRRSGEIVVPEARFSYVVFSIDYAD